MLNKKEMWWTNKKGQKCYIGENLVTYHLYVVDDMFVVIAVVVLANYNRAIEFVINVENDANQYDTMTQSHYSIDDLKGAVRDNWLASND